MIDKVKEQIDNSAYSLNTMYKRSLSLMGEMILKYTLEIGNQSFMYDKLEVKANELPARCIEMLCLLDEHTNKLGMQSKDIAKALGVTHQSVDVKLKMIKRFKFVDTLGSFRYNRYVLTGSGKAFIKGYYKYMRKALVVFTNQLVKYEEQRQ